MVENQIQKMSRNKLAARLNSLMSEVRNRIQAKGLLHSAAASSSGDSYVNIIPFVTRENNSRTNLGINNYSEHSFVNGTNPNAAVLIGLYDSQGTLDNADLYVVGTHQMVQINDVISALQGSTGTGWLMMFSDEPFTGWASVISNSTNDPSIEMAVPLQLAKPSAYIEGLADGFEGTRLLIPSSVKSATYQSSLVVLNIGTSGGNFAIKILDNTGQVLDSKSSYISTNGLYVNNDIRSSVNGTFGEIVIEPNDDALTLIANSVVRSSSGNGAFFPAYTLPPAERVSIGGVWTGSLTGGSTNAQVKVTLFQEKSMLYGMLEITSGTFPTTPKQFFISGGVRASGLASVTIDDVIDSDSALSWISFRMIGAINSAGTALEGATLYTDEQNRQNYGSFSLSRTGDVFQ
jgi:hypothetical protein